MLGDGASGRASYTRMLLMCRRMCRRMRRLARAQVAEADDDGLVQREKGVLRVEEAVKISCRLRPSVASATAATAPPSFSSLKPHALIVLVVGVPAYWCVPAAIQLLA